MNNEEKKKLNACRQQVTHRVIRHNNVDAEKTAGERFSVSLQPGKIFPFHQVLQKFLGCPHQQHPEWEDVFSGLNIITPQRASLHPAHVDAVVFLHASQDCKSRTMTEQSYGGERVNKLYFSREFLFCSFVLKWGCCTRYCCIVTYILQLNTTGCCLYLRLHVCKLPAVSSVCITFCKYILLVIASETFLLWFYKWRHQQLININCQL